MDERVESLNSDCVAGLLDGGRLSEYSGQQGDAFGQQVQADRPHLFSGVAYFVSGVQLEQMRAVVAAIERIVRLPGWMPEPVQDDAPLGVFYGYDFHLNAQGAHLIEINTNAGGAFLNALLFGSQRGVSLPGGAVAADDPEHEFVEMFRNEWRRAHGDRPLDSIAIIDEQPQQQYLYPEFLLAQRLFERAGICAYIADPSELQLRDNGLLLGEHPVDLVYNRLTDFTLQSYPVLLQAYRDELVVVTPNPAHHNRYADKRNLARLSDADGLRVLGADEADIATLIAGVPETVVVRPELEERLWAERKQWFFKPNAGFGSKGAYRGEKLTKRVFGEIMQSDYVAQRLAAPGERAICLPGAEPQWLKSDVRCYVYDGQLQLVAARLYQGQTTNFRTPGGGFAPVRVVG